MNENLQYSTFLVGGILFGVPVDHVQEVIRHSEITRVPLAPAVVRGLVSLRGQIIIAIEVRRCLGLADRPEEQLPIQLIFRSEGGSLCFLVDEIGAVLELDASQTTIEKETLTARLRGMVHRVYKLPERLLLVLDTERMLQRISTGEGATMAPAAGAVQ